MSDLLDTLIKERRKNAKEYEKYLQDIVVFTRQVTNPTGNTPYPKSLNTRAKQALFDNLNNDEQLALAIDAAIQRTKRDSWRGNQQKEREIQKAIYTQVKDEALTATIFELVKKQREY